MGVKGRVRAMTMLGQGDETYAALADESKAPKSEG